MRDYAERIKHLRESAEWSDRLAVLMGRDVGDSKAPLMRKAADAIEELLRIGAKMHTWIFLHTTDEQAAYDEIGLTEEQNALFGYSGQMILKAESPKDDAG